MIFQLAQGVGGVVLGTAGIAPLGAVVGDVLGRRGIFAVAFVAGYGMIAASGSSEEESAPGIGAAVSVMLGYEMIAGLFGMDVG